MAVNVCWGCGVNNFHGLVTCVGGVSNAFIAHSHMSGVEGILDMPLPALICLDRWCRHDVEGMQESHPFASCQPPLPQSVQNAGKDSDDKDVDDPQARFLRVPLSTRRYVCVYTFVYIHIRLYIRPT